MTIPKWAAEQVVPQPGAAPQAQPEDQAPSPRERWRMLRPKRAATERDHAHHPARRYDSEPRRRALAPDGPRCLNEPHRQMPSSTQAWSLATSRKRLALTKRPPSQRPMAAMLHRRPGQPQTRRTRHWMQQSWTAEHAPSTTRFAPHPSRPALPTSLARGRSESRGNL